MIYSVIGLIFDLIGVLLLFVFGILPDNLWKHIMFDDKMSEKDQKIHKLCSKIAISFVLLGFALQLVGNINQSYNSNEIKNFTKTINLGIDKNETLNITGELKLKFKKDKLFYQIEFKGNINSINNIDYFKINLEDKDGFKIYEISVPNRTDNDNLSTLVKDEMAILQAKSELKFDKKDFQSINKWQLFLIMK